MDDSPPIRIPGFEIKGIAGRGGMGIVYRAEQDSPRRLVALKVLHQARTDPESLEALRKEAELAAGLEHPAIVPLYDYGEHNGTPYLVMRYMPGGTAADQIGPGQITLEQAVEWVARISEALDFAHQRGVVHRDVKPSNFLLDDSGNAYLTDFGIAGALEGETPGDATGSAPYMAPEQARGEEADYRSDLYALGVSLFELLTGELPYTAETALGVRARHMHDPIPSARTRNNAIPAAVDELIRWSMAKEPGQRPNSAREFTRFLHRAVQAPAEPLRPPRTEHAIAEGTATARRSGRSWAWLLLAGAIVAGGLFLILGLGAVAAILLNSDQNPSPSATVPSTATSSAGPPTPVGQLFSFGFEEASSSATATPDADGSVRTLAGVLEFQVLREGVEWFYPSRRVSERDVYQSLDVTRVSGPRLNEVGLLCRWQDPANFTALAVSASGEASIWQIRSGQVTRLAGWSPGPVIEGPGSMEADCSGENLTLIWNGEQIIQATDPDPRDGDVGILVGLRESGELVVQVDNWVAERR